MVSKFAEYSGFRKKSSYYSKGLLHMSYDDMKKTVTIGGSYCSLPHELLFSSPAKVSGQVEGVTTSAYSWFKGHGIVLEAAPYEENTRRQN